ncbi:hypothetical protein GLOIN_2v1548496 [Rhizophagus irregularis DAOM 181602=DAOM 197198]|nr:hypothetical protein GLOIN_2v1548496 [Rhizophagus irregularis DAOM 181602=DAOM 197198]
MEYKIENVNNLKKRCEKAMKIVPNYGEFTKNYFSIKKEKLSDIITQWQNNYPDLYYELEQWKEGTGFTHETIALLRKTKSKKVVECVFLKIYESEGTDILNCVNIYRNYPKPSKILKARNIIFKHKITTYRLIWLCREPKNTKEPKNTNIELKMKITGKIYKDKLNDIINMWKEKFQELSDELELWKFSEGDKYTKKEILRPLHGGKELKCVFLKVFDKGEEENTLLRCVSISGDISIKVKVNRFFKLMRWVSEDEKKYIKLIKSYPEVIAALIMSRRVGLKLIWENEQRIRDRTDANAKLYLIILFSSKKRLKFDFEEGAGLAGFLSFNC